MVYVHMCVYVPSMSEIDRRTPRKDAVLVIKSHTQIWFSIDLVCELGLLLGLFTHSHNTYLIG